MGMLEWHTYGLRQERIGHGDQDVGRGAEVTGVEGPGASWLAQAAKEQKLRVLTSMRCNIHGFGRGEGTLSTGRALLRAASSSAASLHTMSLWSLPCLLISQSRD